MIRLIGVYVPLSADATPGMLVGLVESEAQTCNKEGVAANHGLTRDFNQHTWAGITGDLCHEWPGAYGILELSYPMIPTHTKGSALGKFLLLPGANILEELLPAQAPDWSGEQEGGAEPDEDPDWYGSDGFSPARTCRLRIIADHHPVLLRMKGAREQSPSKVSSPNLA